MISEKEADKRLFGNRHADLVQKYSKQFREDTGITAEAATLADCVIFFLPNRILYSFFEVAFREAGVACNTQSIIEFLRVLYMAMHYQKSVESLYKDSNLLLRPADIMKQEVFSKILAKLRPWSKSAEIKGDDWMRVDDGNFINFVRSR